MPTDGEFYNPIVTAITEGNRDVAERLLRQTGLSITLHNPDRCRTLEEGINAARLNLHHYVGCFDDATAATVRRFLGAVPVASILAHSLRPEEAESAIAEVLPGGKKRNIRIRRAE